MTTKDLIEIYQQEMGRTRDAVNSMNWESHDEYCEWLAQTYFYAVHSTRIIGLAGAMFSLERQALHLRFMEHAKEEKGHEKILLLDLKELKSSIETYKPNALSLALFQTQYYWIQNVDPISVFGYFLYLEGLAIECGPPVYARLSKVFPEKATRYFKVHVEEDVDHVREHFDKLNFASPKELELIAKNLEQTGQIYRDMLTQIRNVAKKSGLRAA